jgi:hypothetical protein
MKSEKVIGSSLSKFSWDMSPEEELAGLYERGDPAGLQERIQRRVQLILMIANPNALPVEALFKLAKSRKNDLKRALQKFVRDGQVTRSGLGTRASPFLYSWTR